MGINSRVTKTETLDWAVDILLFKKYCLEHKSFEKRWYVSRLWQSCSICYFWFSDNRDEKLAEIISRFELKFHKSGSQDFNIVFNEVFPRKWLGNMRISKQDYFDIKRLVGYVLNRNLNWREYHYFSDYKEISKDIKQELEKVFISKMEKYQSKTKWELVESFTTDKREIYTEYDTQEDNLDWYKNEDEENEFDVDTESIDIFEFDLEKRYLTAKSNKENIENRQLTKHEIEEIVKKVITEFETEYEWFDESEINEVKSLFYKRISVNN